MTLLLYFLVYFLLGFFWRSVQVYRVTGINPLVLPSSDDPHGYVGRAFKALMGALLVFLVLHASSPDRVLEHGGLNITQPTAWLEVAGWSLLVGSGCWMLIAQTQMGASWRIGIDTHQPTALVSHGLFALSRNPIFLSVRISLLGLLFVLPHAATLSILVAGELLMQIQVRLEEQHLRALHGDTYVRYQNQVRRWI